MPKLKIVTKSIADLKPAPWNPRKDLQPDDPAYKNLKASLDEFDCVEPLVWNSRSGHLVSGHQRLKILKERGAKRVQVSVVDLTAAREKALAVILNSRHHAGEFTADLHDILESISADIPQVASALNLEDLLTEIPIQPKAGLTDSDAVPEPPKNAVTKPGDLWCLGEHRLLCGDSTKAKDMKRLMESEKAEMMFADPPYGVNYDGGHFHSGNVHIKRSRERLAGDETSDMYAAFLPIALAAVHGPCYVWFAGREALPLFQTAHNLHCKISGMIIWHKMNATYAAMRAQYKVRHEVCLYFNPPGSTRRWCGPTNERTVWELKRDPKNILHPTQKPVALPYRAISNHTAKSVLDPFVGSGTTIIAAEQLGRRCYGIEIEPKYCDVAVKRWEQFTGKKAKREKAKR